MTSIDKAGCRINDCGKPLAPLDSGLQKEEDNFRACAEHLKKLRAALRKLQGDR